MRGDCWYWRRSRAGRVRHEAVSVKKGVIIALAEQTSGHFGQLRQRQRSCPYRRVCRGVKAIPECLFDTGREGTTQRSNAAKVNGSAVYTIVSMSQHADVVVARPRPIGARPGQG